MRKQSTGEALTWGYSKENGPDNWHQSYPSAKGNNQSPIAILSKDVYKDPALLPWRTGYDPGAAKNIRNTGKTVRITFDDTFDRSVLRGGPLPEIYRLRQLHIHWGSTSDKGSEHVVDAKRHAGEIHLVHWNSFYSNYNDALRKTDGVAIIAILMQGKEAPFLNFDPSILFPQNRGYYTYQGSFTTPPCEECVTWIVMKEPINVDEQQMLKLRSLSSNSAEDPHCPLVDNWRPLQPLNTRMIRSTCQ
ncbi:carbonic anhydrase 3-like isoform X3 [Ahaetulla prasina]|uniref:carbonic anhydrase 3-like isoform X3 n=1 Tax=Ahaetulla prasina TaxID=499056 RepID=UPI002647A4F1|nr:carbonic anhydrase 3-like isoform X3 [Ahaetulla prasina]